MTIDALLENMGAIFGLSLLIGIVASSWILYPAARNLANRNSFDALDLSCLHVLGTIGMWCLFNFITDNKHYSTGYFDFDYTLGLASPFMTSFILLLGYFIKEKSKYMTIYIPFIFTIYYILFDKITL